MPFSWIPFAIKGGELLAQAIFQKKPPRYREYEYKEELPTNIKDLLEQIGIGEKTALTRRYADIA